ncbi:MAG TPA: hypothetical protein VG013_32865, partial [Gemmataceae bacterium]|nr:hypothetical protein [Gemmataceae bacterium]
MLQFIKALWAKASRTRGSASRRSPLVTLNLECLEQRCLPSILWIGGHGSNWSNRLNWQGGVLPGPNDTAEFNKNSPSSTVDVNRTIGGVQLDPGFGSALIINQGKTLKISGGSEAAGIITGPGTFEIQHSFTWSGGRMGLASNARGTTQIDKGASMLISGTASAKNLFLSFRTVQNLGDVTFAADQLRFRDSTFTNRGKFMITGDGDLTLDSRDATSRFDNFGIFSKIGTPGIPGILP